jgi:hypothetical protein
MTQKQAHEHKSDRLPQNLEQRLAKLQTIISQIENEDRGAEAVERSEELYDKLWHSIRNHAKGLDMQHASRALTIFHDSYHIHKEKHGSYKGFIGSEDYAKLMNERYLFCYEEAMKYLNHSKQ